MNAFKVAKFNAEQMAALPEELRDLMKKCQVWINDKYQVAVRKADTPKDWPMMAHLSIKRLDKEPIHDWRDLQEIKNKIIGPENEGIEIYPAESRLVDSANQYHLWVFMKIGYKLPLGFGERFVKDAGDLADYPDAKQRPFNKDKVPHCCSNDEDEDGICRNYDKRARFRHKPCPHSRACYNWWDTSFDQPNAGSHRQKEAGI